MSIAPNLSDFTKEDIKETLNEIRNPFDVAVWGSSNYFNAGAIVRTCHTFLVRNIFLIDCPAMYERASMGCEKYENIIKTTMEQFIHCGMGKRNIVAMERRPDLITENLVNFKWPENPILLFGCEKTGIPNELLNISKCIVSIPQYGIHNDMNLSTAAGIAIYDWIAKNLK